MEVVSGFVQNVVDYTVGRIGHQLGYLIFYKRNLKNLKAEVENLQSARERLQHEVDAATWDAQEIERDVEDWCRQVDELVKGAESIYEDEGKGSCPHLLWRHQLSRKATKMTLELKEKMAKGKFDRVGYNAAPQGISSTVTPAIDYEALESRTNATNKIIETLKDPSFHTVGVWGPGGVGKTTLAKEVERQAKNQKLFGAVVMTKPVTENPNVENVQRQIANSLGLTLNESSEEGRADKLRKRIKKEKSILVIVDDIWGGVDLEQIGIPVGDEHMGCKLLLTSRNVDVLRRNMRTQKEFELKLLGEEESLSLFEKMAGDVAKDPKVRPIANEIVKSCAGLPVLIVAMAKSLEDEELYAWKDALKKLKPFDKDGMHEAVYSGLELSYNNLKSEELKSLFLLIALQGRYHVYKYDLLIFSVGLRLFKNIDTLEEARNRLHTLTHKLKVSGLLIEDEKRWIAIHDVVREAAVSIASKDQKVFSLQAYSELKEWPERDWLSKCRQIFLPWCYMRYLPEKLESPELQVLALENPGNYMQIPDSFFEETRALKVLDICGMMCSPTPPTSLGYLKDLRALYLYQCALEDIRLVGELTNLRILSLSKSTIQQLPSEIGQLDRLQLLDLDRCYYLNVIPPKVISNLTSLEELYMGNSFVKWEVEGWKNENTNASLHEMQYLQNLTSIDLHLPNAQAWPVDLFFEKLERFRIFIGDVWSWGGVYESKTLKLKLNRSIESESGIKTLLKNVDDLTLDELNGVKVVLNDLNIDGFPLLKYLTIQNNTEIKCIAMSTGQPLYAFPNLESLALYNLNSLEHICHGPLAGESFCKIRDIKIHNCDKLKNVLSNFMINGLSHLSEIEISESRFIETIVLLGEAENLDIEFSELRSVTLQRLPVLIRFCSHQAREIDRGEHLSSFPVTLFSFKVSFPALETMIITETASLTAIWSHHQIAANSFCKLKHVEIKYCEKLVTIFPASVVENLHNLETLVLSNCSSVEGIFEIPEPNERQSQPGMGIELKSLSFVQLPRLKHIWNNTNLNGIFNFQNLEKVYVEDCPLLNYVFPASVAKYMVQLKEVTIQSSPTTVLYG